MKKLLFLPLAVMLVALFSCSSDDDGPSAPSNLFTVHNTVCKVVKNADATTSILMQDAQFAAKMPAMDILFPGVPCSPCDGGVQLIASEFVPQISMHGAWYDYERYIVSNLTGSETSDAGLVFQCHIELGKIAFSGAFAGTAGDTCIYRGTTYVTSPDGELSDEVPVVSIKVYENISSTMEQGDNAISVTLTNVSFSPMMPAMSIRLSDIPLGEGGEYCTAELVPEVSMFGSPFMPSEEYKMRGVRLLVGDASFVLQFTLSMGNMQYDAVACEEGYTGSITNRKISE